MSKKFLMKVLALTMSAALIMQPITAFAEENPDDAELLEESDVPAEEPLPEAGTFTEDGTLPALQNVRVEGEFVYWEPLEGVHLYGLETCNHVFCMGGHLASIDTLIKSFEGDSGTYIVHLDGRDNMGNVCTQVYEFEYEYTKKEELPPNIDYIEAVEATSNVAALIDGRSHSVPDIVDPNGKAVFESTWEKYDPSVTTNGGFVDIGPGNEEEFPAGAYRVKTTMSVAGNPTMALAFDDFVSLTVDGQEWTNIHKYTYTDLGVETAEFISPVYILNEKEPEPPIIDAIEATSDFSQLEADGIWAAPKFVESNEYASIETMYWRQLQEDGSWRIIGPGNGEAFAPGKYRCEVKVALDYDWRNRASISEKIKLTVNGTPWELKELWGANDIGYNSVIFNSPVVTIGEVAELPEIKNVKVNFDLLTWDAVEGTPRYYVSAANGAHIVVSETSVDLFALVSSLNLETGTYPFSIVGIDEDQNPTTKEYTGSFYYEAEPIGPIKPVDVIMFVYAESDMQKLIADKDHKAPTITDIDDEVVFTCLGWEKELSKPGSWKDIGVGDGEAFEAGKYRCKVLMDIKEDIKDFTILYDKIALYVGDDVWFFDEVYESNDEGITAATFYSPAFEIKEYEPEEPENITGGRWYVKWGATYYETQEGLLLQGLKQIDGAHYFFNKNGTVKKDANITIDGKTYYFDKTGKLYTGLLNKWGATYFYYPEMILGFYEIEDKTYFFRPNTGAMVKDQFISADGKTYFLKADGTMAKDETILKWTVMYKFDEDGHLVRTGRW